MLVTETQFTITKVCWKQKIFHQASPFTLPLRLGFAVFYFVDWILKYIYIYIYIFFSFCWQNLKLHICSIQCVSSHYRPAYAITTMITHYQFVWCSHRLRLTETLVTLTPITYSSMTALAALVQYGSYYIPKSRYIYYNYINLFSHKYSAGMA